MDLGVYLRVFWRFRVLVSVGLILAITLTLLSVTRVSLAGGVPSVEYREQQQWTSSSTVFITQPGFPLGRSIYDDFIQLGGSTSGVPPTQIPRYSDPNRFGSYANVLSRLASSDGVRDIMLRDGKLSGGIAARPVTLADTVSTLPLVEVLGIAATPKAALNMAQRGTLALIEFVKRQQQLARIPKDKRIELQVINRPQTAQLTVGRSMTRPAFIFFALLSAVIALTFVLENLRPRVRVVQASEREPQAVHPDRRSKIA